MTSRPSGPPTIVETIPQLEWLAKRLEGLRRLGVDIESDSFYVYHEKVCLLQLSSPKEDFVIDPLAVKDLSPLSHLFRDPTVEKVFHAGEYDVQCLKRDYGFEIVSIFDTMIAARALGAKKLGLAALIEQYFGVKLSKKLQRANWGKRPLTPEQIEYARLDTHYLLPLRDLLHSKLEEGDRLQDALEAFKKLESLKPLARSFDPEGFWALPGARALNPKMKAVLKELYLYREKKAAQFDRAPFRVMPEELLVRLAEREPKNLQELRQLQGMTPYLFQRFGEELLEAIHRGLKCPPIEKPPERPSPSRFDAKSQRRYEALRAWRKDLAKRRGVEPVVILGTEELRRLALAPAESGNQEAWLTALSPHKKESYAEEILRILREPVHGARLRRKNRRK